MQTDTCNYCDLPRRDCKCPEVNQCDGCRRNLLLDHKGIHRLASGWPEMGCTADRYKRHDAARSGEEKP